MRPLLWRALGPAVSLCTSVLLLAPAAAPAFAKSGAAPAKTTRTAATKTGEGVVPATSIVGAAWKSDNKPISRAKLRLRNVVSGKIEGATTANEAGEFVFSSMESGSYIVELVSDTGHILAISHTIAVGPGQTVVTFVRLGTKVPWFNGFFANAASAIASAAAATGVTAVAPEAMECASPPCKVQ